VRKLTGCVKKRPLDDKNVFLFGLVTVIAMIEFETDPRRVGRNHKIHPS
jgi:hypothetical protein